MFVGIALDCVLMGVSRSFCHQDWKRTAIGFASVLTKREVTLRVRDMVGYERVLRWGAEVYDSD